MKASLITSWGRCTIYVWVNGLGWAVDIVPLGGSCSIFGARKGKAEALLQWSGLYLFGDKKFQAQYGVTWCWFACELHPRLPDLTYFWLLYLA